MKQILLTAILTFLMSTTLHARQSFITNGEGYACMGDDKSRKTTETTAMADAKRKATESAATYIQAETHIKDAMLQKDLLSAYANAQVKVIQELLKEWYKEQGLGDCYRVKLKVEVIPDENTMSGLAKKSQEALDQDPAAPLSVKIWTDRPAYAEKECMRIYLKGNKPFYGRVVYKQADGTLVQLLPNPYRDQDYFNGGTVYELPSGEDRFNMETCAPFGSEQITIYASTVPTGHLDVTPVGAVFAVANRPADIPIATRGVKLVPKSEGSGQLSLAEFSEGAAMIITRGGIEQH
uniref:DUF4384 domain-containing protein n=1 Tax=Geobacter sp. (strain M21) TaxID=443144 RepID=C6DZC3_GEOSM